ncbi:MAG: TIGR04282 family arsenosugar biosynthesis glycosyltransferase [Planctomycetes bacterium]|nr:TIGR04282 family arsenosugar biosynthesis glycosyltransferase [Planctomycetota bacterium]
MKNALVLMTKSPEPGRVKTRLGLSPEAAAGLQEAFLRDLIARHRSQDAYDLVVAVDPAGAREEFRARFGVETIPQTGADLGERLAAVCVRMLASRARGAIIGSDLPQLDVATVRKALDALDGCDVSLGPTRDGGYYLIALGRTWPLFHGIPWSTPRVLATTLLRARSLGLRVHLLDPRRDVDTPEDLAALAEVIGPDVAPATCSKLRELRCASPSSSRR